jgi:60 kDa SS-A/Ro ribonucleoprotein
MKAYGNFSTRKTPQREAIPGVNQVKNNAGGFVFDIGTFAKFERFLILGSEGGTYYVGERELTKDNALNTIAAIAADGKKAVDLIVDVSDKGRAPKNDPALFALALAASAASAETRTYALAALPKVARIPTHLFHFATYVQGHRGWGRSLKRAVASWYNNLPVEKLAFELVKYQSRDGWSNADLLRLSHPSTTDAARNAVYRWALGLPMSEREIKAWKKLPARHYAALDAKLPAIIDAFEEAKTASKSELVRLIQSHRLTREMVPTEALNEPEIWEALLEKMPYTAMLRNLATMTRVGLLKPLSAAANTIASRLTTAEALKFARVHPIDILVAQKTYASGRGFRGTNTWTPVPKIVDALDDAFYAAFEYVEPTNKRHYIGLDVSGSMHGAQVSNLNLTAAEGGAAMAMACIRTEPNHYVRGFAGPTQPGRAWSRASDTEMRDLGFTPKMRLTEALNITRAMNFGTTDCALPMLDALRQGLEVDVFTVITDNETWAGGTHPSQALREYREKTGINAKQVVIAMTPTSFSIADPNDPRTLDIAGFDTTVPQVLADFARG